MNDFKAGESCTINGKDAFTTFCADLVSLSPRQIKLRKESRKDGGDSPTQLINSEISGLELEAEFLVSGKDSNMALANAAALVQECRRCTLGKEGEPLYYDAALDSASSPPAGIDGFSLVKLSFTAVLLGPAQTVLTYQAGTAMVQNSGIYAVPALVTVTPLADTASLTIKGLSDSPITLRNLQKGKSVLFDGETVTQDGVNKFGDCELWELPRLLSGNNEVSLSISSCTAKITFSPRYA